MPNLTRYAPFDSGAGANVYEDQWREMAKHWVSDGIISSIGSAMAVSATTGMVLAVASGSCFIQGHFGALDATANVSISTAHATLPRIDRVVLRLDTVANTISTEVLTGTANASPVAPTLTTTSATYEILLATIAVAAAATSITAPNITDGRTLITPKNGLSGFINAGTRTTLTGAGTPGSPYVINADQTIVNAGTRTSVTGAGTAGSPYVINADQTIVNAGTGAAVSGAGTAGSPYVVVAKNRYQLANPVRNASMHVWQRGTSIAFGGSTYGPDGYQAHRAGGVSGGTISSQAAGDTQGSQTCARVQRDNGNSNTAGTYITQSIATDIAKDWANKTATFSFRARCGANFSAASSLLTVQLYTGTGNDQNVLGGYTGSANPINSTATLTTSWQTFTFTGSIAAGITEMGFYLYFTPVGTAGAADHFEVKDIRIDEGSYALDHAPLTYSADLSDAEYYLKLYSAAGAAYTLTPISVSGFASSIYGSSNCPGMVTFGREMRPPTSVDLVGSWFLNLGHPSAGSAGPDVSALSISQATGDGALLTVGVASAASSVMYWLCSKNDTTARIRLRNEL